MKSNFSGLVVALLTGAVLGVLLAPRSGRATRKKFSGDSERFLKELQDTISTGFERIRQQYEETRDTAASGLNEAIDSVSSKAKSAIERPGGKSKY